MADVTKPVRRRSKAATQKVEDTSSDVQDQAQDATASDESGDDDAQSSDSQGDGRTISAELKDTFRDAAIEVLRPVVKQATTTAAKFAVTQGPTLMKNRVGPKIEQAGGAGELAKGLKDKGGGVAEKVGGLASGAGGAVGGLAQKLGGGGKKEGESPSGTGRGRRLPVQEYIDVGVDIQTAYDQYTQFEDWPEFMHRVERIEQRDDSTLMWHENIWGVRRSWEAEITDQEPCERIAWRSKGGTQTIGVVTFHRLADRLTRIYVTVDFQPKGLFEKTASGLRISRKALKSDLMRFKAFIELKDEPTGGWHGRIEEGEVVDDGSDEETEGQDTEARSDEDQGDEESQASEDEEVEEEEGEEPEASEDEDFADEDEEDEEEEGEQDKPAKGRFKRDDESSSSDDEEPEEQQEAPPTPRRRRRRTATSSTTSRR